LRAGRKYIAAIYDSSMSVKVKICGVTSMADAELGALHGAWAIGMVFHPESPRACDPAVAAEIGTALKRRLEVVGVFVNAPLDELVDLAESASLSMLQLHGEEGPAYCQEAARRTGLKVIKAARVRDTSTVRGLQAYHTDFHMLDAYVPGVAGGTGKRFDWSLAGAHPGTPPVILSGGITPENVTEAISTVNPYAVDTATGVEQAPGRKDPDKVKLLFEAVRYSAPARA
jgi:phosphoribosylanthranilate isomerase